MKLRQGTNSLAEVVVVLLSSLLSKACNNKIRFYLSSKSSKSLPEIQCISVHEVLQLNQKGILTPEQIFESSHPYIHVDACMLTQKHIQSPFHLT